MNFNDSTSKDMSKGEEIYKKSIAIIDSLLKDNRYFSETYSEAEKSVVKRVIHATSDMRYAETIFFTNDSAKKGIELIREKTFRKEPLKIVCDSEMTKAGISKNVNKNILLDLNCYIGANYKTDDSDVTKSALSIRAAISQILPNIIVIGNAPTALIETIDLCKHLYKTINYKPSLIIAMPVGLVGAAESKIILHEDNFYSSIGNFGNIGGSSSAASAVNALLREGQ